jgi:hypothetical protein
MMIRRHEASLVLFLACSGLVPCPAGARAADKAEEKAATSTAAPPTAAPAKSDADANPQEPVPLNPQGTVLLDKANKKLILKTEVCLREGALEFLVTVKGTKEHEAILAIDTKAYVIHTGLLALGAKPGKPAFYGDRPEDHRPPTGQRIDLFLSWTGADGKPQRVPAQEWVRHLTRRFYLAKEYDLPAGIVIPKASSLRYDRKHRELSWYGPMTDLQREQLFKLSTDATFRGHLERFQKEGQSRGLEAKWVFPGSGFYTNPETGKKFYLAEDGDLICVANFSSAMLDVDVTSTSQGTDNLLFEAWTEKIPEQGTAVTLELVPVFEDAAVKTRVNRAPVPKDPVEKDAAAKKDGEE